MQPFFHFFAQTDPATTAQVINQAGQAAVKLSESNNSLVLACGLVLFLIISGIMLHLLIKEKDERIKVEKSHGEEVKSILSNNTDAMKSIENSLSMLANRKQINGNQLNQNQNN